MPELWSTDDVDDTDAPCRYLYPNGDGCVVSLDAHTRGLSHVFQWEGNKE